MKRMIIIGAGYVGAELMRRASQEGWEVYGVTKSGEGQSVRADVRSLSEVQALQARFPEPSVLVHCASSGRGGIEAYEAVFHQGVKNLLEAFSDIPLIFVSSTSVYGQVSGEVVTEESITEPQRETGKILLKAEGSTLAAGGMVARLAGIYGPGRSVLLKKLLSGEARIEEDGRRVINQIHRDDAASALLFLAEKLSEGNLSGECFNVADSSPRSQRETYEELCKRFSFPLPALGEINHHSKRGWSHKVVSNEKLIQAGWSPAYPDFLEAAEEVLSHF